MNLGIFGPQGSGKSLIAMLIARYLQSIDNNLDLYTNMNVDGNNVFTINDLSDLPLNDRRNKIFIIDEAYFTLDSRNSSSSQNRIWSKVYALFRKSDVVLVIFITHRPRMIDVNIREQINYFLMCRKNPKYFEYLLIDSLSEFQKSFTLPKNNMIYDFANYNTRDFPNPISVEKLLKNPLFNLPKK